MAKKKKYDESEGVWRTIGGRRVFIRTGQSLSEAMRDSGKFKKASDIKRGTYQRENAYIKKERIGEPFQKVIDERREIDNIIREKTYDENSDSFFESPEYKKMINRRGELLEKEKKLTDEANEYEEEYLTRLYGAKYKDHPKRYKGDISKLDGKHIARESDYSKRRIEDGKEIYETFRQMSDREMKEFAKAQPDAIKKMQEFTKDQKLEKARDLSVQYDSVVDRYNKDKSFRDMLKNEHQKTMDFARKDISGYLDDTEGIAKQFGIQDKDDLYNYMNKNYYSIDRDDFDKLYSEEASKRYDKVDKEWVDLAKKMEDYYNENGTTNWVDEAKLNKLSKERDSLLIYRDKDYYGSQFVEGANTENKYKTGDRVIYNGQEVKILHTNRDPRYGNEYLVRGDEGNVWVTDHILKPAKEKKMTDYERANFHNEDDLKRYQSTKKDILDHYTEDYGYSGDSRKAFLRQMEAVNYENNTPYEMGRRLAEGGDYLIYNGDMKDYLNKKMGYPYADDDNAFDKYIDYMGKYHAEMYNELFEEYKREHKNSKLTKTDFKKWFMK